MRRNDKGDHARTGLGPLSLAAAAIAAAIVGGLGSAQPPPPPGSLVWTEARLDAVVRIQVTTTENRPIIGTGFIVQGRQDYYVMTSTHVLYGRGADNRPSEGCAPLGGTVELTRRDIGGETLSHGNCSWNLGADLSLVPLAARPRGYPTLQLAAHDPKINDAVHLAGFPYIYPLDSTGAGFVFILRIQDDLVAARMITFEGMSGGPYLSDSGTVVGVHNGGAQYIAGMAQFTSIFRTRPILEPRVGPIPADNTLPQTPVQVADSNLARANLGTFLALQFAPTDRRLSYWQTFVGRAATTDEALALQNLPVASPTAEATTLFASLDGPAPPSRPVVSESLAAAAALTRLSCSEEAMSIREGLLYCGEQSRFYPSPNRTDTNVPRVIVLHYTASFNLAGVIGFMFDQSRTASAHFIVDRDGSFVQVVPINRGAFHAGPSQWQGLTGLNRQSVGIELINVGQVHRSDNGGFEAMGRAIPVNEVQAVTRDGQTTYWHRFTGAQLLTAQAIARKIAAQYPIQDVVGHCTIARPVGRRIDPGPAFPMAAFGQAVLGRPSVGCP